MKTTNIGDAILTYLKTEGVILSPTNKERIQLMISSAITEATKEGYEEGFQTAFE